MSRLIDIPDHDPKSRKGTLAQWRMRLASSAANSRLNVGDLIAQSPLWAQHGGCHNHVFKPELSLAQKMSDHFGINVHAFLRRSYYGDVLRDKSQSKTISSTLKEARKASDGQVIDLPPDHEALPHPGLADDWNPASGPKREGTDNYALWRKGGGIKLPTAADTPTGLPSDMRVFRPKK